MNTHELRLAQELFAQPCTGNVDNRNVANYRTHTIRSGDQLEVEAYPLLKAPPPKRVLTGKATSAAQAEVNDRNQQKRIIRLVNANFDRNDLTMTLSYNGAAPTLERARKDMNNWLKAVKRRYMKRGLEYKWLYVIEYADAEGNMVRIHHHVILSGGMDRDELEALWKHGRAQSRRLQPDDYGLKGLAKYISKGMKANGEMQPMPRLGGKKGKRWSSSTNLTKPTETIADRKLSRRRVEQMATGLEGAAKEIFEKLYPGYRFLEVTIKTSQWVPGAYIYVQMVKEGEHGTDDMGDRAGRGAGGTLRGLRDRDHAAERRAKRGSTPARL